MSHIVSVETQIRDAGALSSACRRLGWPGPEPGAARLSEGEAAGLLVRPPGWRYPIVVDCGSGLARYDHFDGRWGDPRDLGRLKQAYAVERIKEVAARRDRSVAEQLLPDGSIRLIVLHESRP
jgi:hypothetical protein